MALENKEDGSDSSSGDEVTPEQAEVLEILEKNSQELRAQVSDPVSGTLLCLPYRSLDQ